MLSSGPSGMGQEVLSEIVTFGTELTRNPLPNGKSPRGPALGGSDRTRRPGLSPMPNLGRGPCFNAYGRWAKYPAQVPIDVLPVAANAGRYRMADCEDAVKAGLAACSKCIPRSSQLAE